MKMQKKRIVQCGLSLICAFGIALSGMSVHAEEMDSLEDKTSNLQSQLEGINQDLVTISNEIAETEVKIEESNNEVFRLEASLQISRNNEEVQYANMKTRIKYMYENGSDTLLSMVCEAKSMGEFLNRVDFIQNITKYDKDMLENMVKVREGIEEQEAELKSRQQELLDLQNQLDSEQAALQAKAEETSTDLATVNAQLEAARAAQKKQEEEAQRKADEQLAKKAQEEILIATTKAQRSLKTLEWLQRALELDAPPERIEAFDISNLGDSGIVAGMTVFQHGRPRKSDYRKFRIRTTDGQNDYGSMHEAVTRRFQHYVDGDPGFCPLPDLLLIDGGTEHASVAQAVLDGFGLQVPVFGMVKDDRHRTRALITPGGHEIGIAANPAVFAFIGTIQEETHRFSIDYQRRLRRESLSSELDQIPGVGEKRRNALLKTFRSVKAIRAASYEELCAAVPAGVARAVYDHYHPKGESPCV